MLFILKWVIEKQFQSMPKAANVASERFHTAALDLHPNNQIRVIVKTSKHPPHFKREWEYWYTAPLKLRKTESSCLKEIPLQMLPMGMWEPENMKIKKFRWGLFDFWIFL